MSERYVPFALDRRHTATQGTEVALWKSDSRASYARYPLGPGVSSDISERTLMVGGVLPPEAVTC